MNPKQMVYLINSDLERRREEEWRALHRRPDALPLPPEEPAIDVGTRLSRMIRGWLHRLPADPIPHARRAGDDEAPAV
jgi:broad specificity phosphatase PhoE